MITLPDPLNEEATVGSPEQVTVPAPGESADLASFGLNRPDPVTTEQAERTRKSAQDGGTEPDPHEASLRRS